VEMMHLMEKMNGENGEIGEDEASIRLRR